jgi:hypothetical protein
MSCFEQRLSRFFGQRRGEFQRISGIRGWKPLAGGAVLAELQVTHHFMPDDM